MAVLHKEFCDFHGKIKLSKNKDDGLFRSRKAIRNRIRNWFSENKPDELQPKFHGQGSFEMDTTVEPITKNIDGVTIREYDLDDGVYFIEKEGEDNKRSIQTWHNWVKEAVDSHTGEKTIDKTTCVRVMYADGHHIDLPIYYKNGDTPELAHKSKDWLESDPKAFYEWFNTEAKKDTQKRKIVRYLKAWKNFRENENSSLSLPSGFVFTILVVNNFVAKDNDDDAFRETIKAIKATLEKKFECLRPTTPEGDDVFDGESETFRTSFLTNLNNLIDACDKAEAEPNFKNASEYMRKQLGDRFPIGKDEAEKIASSRISATIDSSVVKPKPYIG